MERDSSAACRSPVLRNRVLWETAVKLANSSRRIACEPERYCEALAVVVAHELMRMLGNLRRRRPPTRGTLPVWQRRVFAGYIEKHLTEAIPTPCAGEGRSPQRLLFLPRLQAIVRHSTGPLPHQPTHRARRWQIRGRRRRTSRSSWASAKRRSRAAFRHTTGTTPIEYRRTLA
jgi:hypothetical protein